MAGFQGTEDFRFAGDVFDDPGNDSPAFPGATDTDPYEVARVEKVRDFVGGNNGGAPARIRVAGYDDSRTSKDWAQDRDEANSITRNWDNQDFSINRLDRNPEYINPGAPQPGEPGYSGRALNPGEQRDLTQENLNWVQEVGSDAEADALIRSIGERDERARDAFMRNTFGTMGGRLR